MHRKIKRLKEDPDFVENIARQELKMIAKDEIVFIVDKCLIRLFKAIKVI